MMATRPVTVCCLCFSIIFICVGIAALFGFPPIFRQQFNKKVTLTNGSEVFQAWVNPGDSVPVFLKFHIFNYTNAEQILNGAKPNVTEAGVVTYREVLVKENVTFHNGSVTVEYKLKHTYILDESRSTIKENDTVVLPNFVLWTVANSAGDLSDDIAQIVNFLYTNGTEAQNAVSPFYETSVADFIWAREENLFLKFLQKHLMTSLPTKFPLQANESYNGVHEVFTGYDDSNRNRAKYISWNHNKTLHYWGSEQCNAINGTDGSLFSTFMQRPEGLYIFNTQACRSFFFTPTHKIEAFNGIKTLKFAVPSEAFNVSYPGNRCFCPNFHELKANETCTGQDGLIDVSECQVEQLSGKGFKPSDLKLNVSVIMSSPHFLFADNKTINGVNGMKPDEKLHATYLNVEPDSGLLVTGSKRMQFNTLLYHGDNTKNIETLKNLSVGWNVLAPLFWADEHLEVSDAMTSQLEKEFFRPQNAVTFTSFTLIGVGIVILAIVTMIMVFYTEPERLHVVLDTDYECDGGFGDGGGSGSMNSLPHQPSSNTDDIVEDGAATRNHLTGAAGNQNAGYNSD